MSTIPDSLKGYTRDLDKACSPAQTVARVKELLAGKAQGLLQETRRIDTGRLGIPVFLSYYGPLARQVVPIRKQMGKGAHPEQAEASALMELVERYSWFSFMAEEGNFRTMTWSRAEEEFGDELIPLSQVLAAVDEDMEKDAAREILDLVEWRFTSALRVHDGTRVILPLDWFRMLNEFNGSSAGNTGAESMLQGACELVERHVSALAAAHRPPLPTIDPDSCSRDPVLDELLRKFSDQGVAVVLKDFTMGLPVPTVGAVAWDESTFPAMSEIVFTAGTATSPAKTAVRALTEVAQLAGDFATGSSYEASGLPKYRELEQLDWLKAGSTVPLDSLPDIRDPNMRVELQRLAGDLASQGWILYCVETTHPLLGVPAHYNIVPGFGFRERSPQASLGLFVGRRLAEEEPDQEKCVAGLKRLGQAYPEAGFLTFFQGLAALRFQDPDLALLKFEKAYQEQTDQEDKALCAFYCAHALSGRKDWPGCEQWLRKALELDQEVHEFRNLLGVSLFKQERYQEAASEFSAALDLDRGSAVDVANLGLCHKFLGNTTKAVELLAEALELDPGLEFVHEHLDELLNRE
jgi:ribosomal protein S12 methylthiotransferase accessory factor